MKPKGKRGFLFPLPAWTMGLILLAGMLIPQPGQAEESLAALMGNPLETNDLAEVRGGFVPEEGAPMLTFGFERLTYVNGSLTSRTRFSPANPEVSSTLSPSDFSRVLQNNLDHQHLRTLTLLEVRMSGFDPTSFGRLDALKSAQALGRRP